MFTYWTVEATTMRCITANKTHSDKNNDDRHGTGGVDYCVILDRVIAQ